MPSYRFQITPDKDDGFLGTQPTIHVRVVLGDAPYKQFMDWLKDNATDIGHQFIITVPDWLKEG
jgi:hypothetical protein